MKPKTHWTILAAWVVFCVGVAWATTTGAQPIDRDPCIQDCRETHAECVDACGEEPNPMECEANCQDDLEDCTRSCS